MSNIRNRKAVSWHYITMSHVGNTIRYVISKKKNKNERNKKEKKGKENLQGSEKNVVGVKEMAQE